LNNRQRRAVWSRFLRLLVVLISISRPRQSARSGWGHCLTRYRRARSLASRSCYREDRAREKHEPQTQRRGLVEAGTPEILDRHGDLQTVMEADAAPFKNLQPDHGPRCTRCCSPLHSRPLSLIDSPEHLLNQAGAATFNPAQEKRRLRQRANKSAGCLHPAPAVRRY